MISSFFGWLSRSIILIATACLLSLSVASHTVPEALKKVTTSNANCHKDIKKCHNKLKKTVVGKKVSRHTVTNNSVVHLSDGFSLGISLQQLLHTGFSHPEPTFLRIVYFFCGSPSDTAASAKTYKYTRGWFSLETRDTLLMELIEPWVYITSLLSVTNSYHIKVSETKLHTPFLLNFLDVHYLQNVRDNHTSVELL